MVCAGACYDMEETMLRIVQALNTVLNAESIYLLILSVVDAVIKDSVLNLRKDFLILMESEL